MIYVGADTKVSAATTVQNFGDYSSVSDAESNQLRNTILASEDTISVSGTTWYISNDGDDSNAGNSPEASWKTVSAVIKHADKIKAGDAVLFKRGDIFRGNLETVSNISYGAYDEGDKPCIYGSKFNYADETWVSTQTKNVYALRVDITTDIGMIILNHGEAYGYKMLNGVSECNSDYEFYHDINSGIIYMYCSKGRPSQVFYDIELLYNKSGVHVANGAENVYIENLSIKYTGGHGISVGMPVSNVTIKYCEVGWIGGSIHRDDNTRYGNGIQFYGQTTNAVVDHCWVYQCYDAGLTHQYTGAPDGNPEMTAENITYTNNLVEFCTYSLEYFWNWKVNGVPTENANVYMKDILVEDNVMRFAGYGLGKTRPDPVNMGHVVTSLSYNSNENFVIKNNIFDMSTLRLFNVSTYEEANPLFTGNQYIQNADKLLGDAYAENNTKGGRVALKEESLKRFDETGTLVVVE